MQDAHRSRHPTTVRFRACQGLILLIVILTLMLAGCRSRPRPTPPQVAGIHDNRPQVWTQSNARIRKFIRIYSRNNHVRICLERAQDNGYAPYIHRVFYKHRLPPELVYLPLVESCFDTKADSGHARGMWQFVRETAKEYGLRVGKSFDDRLNWRKSTHSAARYLKWLGERFNYDWELALAGYNSGPNYIAREMKRQDTWNYWELNLRKEPYEYVPKFLAMLAVARQHYPDLYYEGGPQFWIVAR